MKYYGSKKLFSPLILALTIAACGDGYEKPVFGTMSDNGGNTYKTVEINGVTWMAENMKYTSDGIVCRVNQRNKGDKECWSPECYEDVPNFKEDYGCLYDLASAMKVCPTGWHLPNFHDFYSLLIAADPHAKPIPEIIRTQLTL